MAANKRQQARKNVVEVLNKARAMELQAIGQYMNQHYNLDDMDYGDLAAKIKLIAVDEMRHAEMFAERIKELGGEPTVAPAAKPVKGQEVEKVFPFNVSLEDNAIAVYNGFLHICHENGDSTTVKLFETVIDEEQLHLNYFANITTHIRNLGHSFLAQIAGTPSATGLATQGFVARQGDA